MLSEIPKAFYRLRFILPLVIAMLPNIILSFDEYIDPFSFSSVGLAQTYSQDGKFVLHPYKVVGQLGWQAHANDVSVRFFQALLLVSLNQITGLSLWQLHFLPIAGIMFILLLYLLGKNLAQSALVATLYAVTMGYEFFPINIYYISVGLNFFLIFLATWLKFVNLNEMKNAAILMLITFVAMFFSYYTAEFLALCFLLVTLTISYVSKKTININVPKRELLTLSLILLIIFAYFYNVVYHYLRIASVERGLESFSSYLNYVMRLLSFEERAILEYRPQISNPFVVYTNAFQLAHIGFSLLVYVLYSMRKSRKKQSELTPTGLMILALFLVGLLQVLVYFFVGFGPHTWTLFLISSFTALLSLDKLRREMAKQNKRRIVAILTIMMLLLPSLGFVKFKERLDDDVNPNGFRLHSLMKATVSWTTLHLTEGDIIADSRTAAQFFMEVTKEGKTDYIRPYKIYRPHYLYTYDPETPYRIFGEKVKYLVLSKEFKNRAFLAGEFWSYVPPLKSSLYFLNYYTSLNKIYDDGRGLVFEYRR